MQDAQTDVQTKETKVQSNQHQSPTSIRSEIRAANRAILEFGRKSPCFQLEAICVMGEVADKNGYFSSVPSSDLQLVQWYLNYGYNKEDGNDHAKLIQNYKEYRAGTVPYTISHEGEDYKRYIPMTAMNFWKYEFDYRFVANCDELTNIAAKIFVGLIAAQQVATSESGGGTTNDLPWHDKDDDDERWERNCAQTAINKLGKTPRIRR